MDAVEEDRSEALRKVPHHQFSYFQFECAQTAETPLSWVFHGEPKSDVEA
jgi:hypothetical protein